MKQLVIIRHAKTEVAGISQSDFDRRLTERGKRNAEEVGQFMLVNEISPDLILVSPAKRTQSTAKRILRALEKKNVQVKNVTGIYEASLQSLLYLLAEVPSKVECVCIIGHNPALQELAEWFLPFHVGHLVPGGLIKIDIPIEDWSVSAAHMGKLRMIFFPDKE